MPSYTQIAHSLGISPNLLYYKRKKFSNPQFHPNKHGGFRCVFFIVVYNLFWWCKFSQTDQLAIRLYLWECVKENPTLHIPDFTRSIQNAGNSIIKMVYYKILGWDVSKSYVKRIFYEWKWTWKKPIYKVSDKQVICDHVVGDQQIFARKY